MFLLFINYLFISFCHVRIYVNCLKYCINHSEARHSKGHEMSSVKQASVLAGCVPSAQRFDVPFSFENPGELIFRNPAQKIHFV